MKPKLSLLLLLVVCLALFLLHPGQVEGIQVLRFQEDRKATTETMAWYQGQLDPNRQLHSVSLCGRFYLFTIHGWATFFALLNNQNEMGQLEGDIWVERVRPVIAKNWNFQLLKKKLWVFKWHHLCFTYDHNKHLISTYVDGSLNNHQEYDIVRTVSGVKARLGQGYVARRSFSGDLTQVNVWDRPLSPEEVRSIAGCQSDPQGNYVSWEGGWTLQNITSYDMVLTKLCSRDAGPAYFWFEWSPYPVADYLCLALGSLLPINKTEAMTAIKVAKNSSYDLQTCYSDYWLAINDIEEDGVWKIGNNPVDMKTVGWGPQEPNGLHYENCAAAIEWGVSDIDCPSNLKCAVCSVNEQQRFSFLGTCENELRNFYLTPFQYNVSEIAFVGYGAYLIQKLDGIWTWVNHVANTTIAQMEEFFPDYPMGRRWWKLHQPVCDQKHGGRRLLLLSPCSYDDFTCDDATCIPLHKRCDLKYDCRDNTDEVECELVAFPEDYQSHLPPRAGGREEKSLPIVLTIDVDFLAVRTMDMVMDLSYELALTWVDNRLKYQNLKVNNTLNILPDDTMHKLWSPEVSFVNTNGNQHTLMDTDTTMLVDRHGHAISRDPAAPAEVEIFSGETNTVTAKRKYGTVYMCDLDLVLYPFDVQECYLHLRITSATKSFLLFDTLKSSVNISANKLLLEYEVGDVLLVHGSSGMYSEVKVKVPLTRRSGYAILTIYIPTLVLLVVSYVTLFFRPVIFDTRMMSALTVQLVIATLFSQVSASLPKTSYFKMVDVWLLFCIAITFLTIIFHVMVDSKVNRSGGKSVRPTESSITTSILVGQKGLPRKPVPFGVRSKWMNFETDEQKMVMLTRITIPAVFIIFNFCYWIYILTY